MSRFRTILSVRKQHGARAGALEAAGVTLMLRWLLRTPTKHGTRVAALVDAQAVIGALLKGRSSAPTLRCEVRRIAALTFAGDFWPRYVYVPTSCNPADAPSRGVVTYSAAQQHSPKTATEQKVPKAGHYDLLEAAFQDVHGVSVSDCVEAYLGKQS
jgi:hypothetical protein